MTRKVAWVNFHLGGVASLQSATKLIDTIRLKGPFKKRNTKLFLPNPILSNVVPLYGLPGKGGGGGGGDDSFSLLSDPFEDSVSLQFCHRL